jgi:hypothetical protein
MVGITEQKTMRCRHPHDLAVAQPNQEPVHRRAIRLASVPCPSLQADRPGR